MSTRDEVRGWLGPKVEDGTDTRRGLSSNLLRSREGDVLRIGIGGEGNVDNHLHALIDLLAWHHYEVVDGSKPGNRVQLLVGRGKHTDRAIPPLRTLRAAHCGNPIIELLVESTSHLGKCPTSPDVEDPPSFIDDTQAKWAGFLTNWYKKGPEGLASEFLARSPSPVANRLRLYPQLSKTPSSARWSLRIDGLQIGQLGSTTGRLRVGGNEKTSQPAVQMWRTINGSDVFAVTNESLDDALDRVKQLATRLESTEGGLLDHGAPEHALESAIVAGTFPVEVGGCRLVPFGGEHSDHVAYGSQIPTQWSPGDHPRYLDALLRDGVLPWAVEMKVKAGGGYGAYLRHAIGQAVLYRHFLRSAPSYRCWMMECGLDARAVRAAVLYPQPTDSVAKRIAGRIGNLWLTAAAFDVQVVTVATGSLKYAT